MTAKIEWLGTGDVSLSSPADAGEFLTHYAAQSSEVSAFGLPHHGSVKNYRRRSSAHFVRSIALYRPNPPKNWKHPHPTVIADVTSQGASSHHVDDRASTSFHSASEQLRSFLPPPLTRILSATRGKIEGVMRGIITASALLASAGAVQANAFDDCVLENMRGASSDVAAKSIKVACLRKTSVAIPDADLRGLAVVSGFYGTYGMTKTAGFTAEIKNNTSYIVTEVTFAITIDGGPAEIYRVDEFNYQEQGVIYAGLPPDPTSMMRIDPLKGRKFQFALDRPEIDKKKKWNWSIAAAKGVPPK